jgi:hypothetical protein
MSHHVTTRSYKKGPHFKTYGKRFGTRTCAGGYIANIYDRGPGLSPGPDRAPISKHCNSNKFLNIYIIRTIVGTPVGRPFPKLFPLPRRSRGRVLPTTKVLNHCPGDTWWPLIGPRVTIPFATNKPRVKK